MKIPCKLLIAAVLFPLFSMAQGNYKPGFVINLKGDTLKGYIDLREWGTNPKNVNFKASLDKAPPQNFTVNDILGFEISRIAAYKQFITSISLDETNIQKLAPTRDTSSKIDNVFLKVQQRGKNVTLFSYIDDIKTRYYIYDSQSGKIAELTYRIYYVANDKNNVSTVSQDAYKEQLLLIAQKFDTYNDNIKGLLEDANYIGSDLQLICRKINNSAKEKEEPANGNKPISFFAAAGLNYNTITRTGTFLLFNATPSHSSIGPKLSAGINFYPNPVVGQSVIRLEVSYTSASYQSTGNFYYDKPDIKSTYSFNQSTISATPQFQFNFYNSDRLKFYLDAGLSFNFSSYSGNSIYNPVTNRTETNLSGLNKSWISIPVKAGVILTKRLEISLTYVPPVSVSNNLGGTIENYNYSFNSTSLQIGVGYIF